MDVTDSRRLALTVAIDVCRGACLIPTPALLGALADFFEGAFTRSDLEVLCENATQ